VGLTFESIQKPGQSLGIPWEIPLDANHELFGQNYTIQFDGIT
jgi:hypothetical protein